ncbi:MAG: hypothetical protein FJZ87_11080 [Chloroflexi bacterium]|nr:hypothetical protein [Chloroflexota bacterium]
MNRQELLKQADYVSQRGNRALALKILSDLISTHSDDEQAWMLKGRIETDPKQRAQCYERVLQINPRNNEARIGLIRLNSISPTLPLDHPAQQSPWQATTPARRPLRSAALILALLLGMVTTTYVIAKNNPQSSVAKWIIPSTPTPFAQALEQDIAAQTRAEVSAEYPQFAPLLDALIGLAVKSAESGMDGAPARPGAEILPFEGAGAEARAKLQGALPQPGSLASVTLDEQQVTSWLDLSLKESPDLPLSEVQVYLRDGRIQIWGMVNGMTNSTSALIAGTLTLDLNGMPGVELESIQIGNQTVPDILLTQGEAWLNQLISQKINEQVPGLEIMNINISNGLITISGMR